MTCSEVSGARIEKQADRGIRTTVLTRGSYAELFISAAPVNGDPLEAFFERMAELLRARRAEIVALDGFGDARRGHEAMRHVWGEIAWPVTWVEEAADAGRAIAGVQVWAVSGAPVNRLRRGGRVVGTIFEDAFAQYCRLGDLPVEDPASPPAGQAGETFEQMDAILREAGMDFGHVVRTWFNNNDILSWYGEFNDARNAFFKQHGVFDGLVPASTGVGNGNTTGGALAAGLLAVKPKSGHVSATMIPSPLQCAAIEYGSSFSRAVDLTLPDCRRLLVSGTASIAPEGHTVHLDDVAGQVRLTMDVVKAILESQGMNWENVSRAIAYFKRAGDMPAWDDYCAAQGLPDLPVLRVNNDICRDDLLFEIELDAMEAG